MAGFLGEQSILDRSSPRFILPGGIPVSPSPPKIDLRYLANRIYPVAVGRKPLNNHLQGESVYSPEEIQAAAERVRNAQAAMRAYLEKKGEDYDLKTHRKLAEELSAASKVYLKMLAETRSK